MLAIALLASSLVLTHLSQRCSSSASEDAFVTTHRLLICASADPSVPLLTYACAALHAHRLLSPSKLSVHAAHAEVGIHSLLRCWVGS